jgi:exodeoxyribonuclease-5
MITLTHDQRAVLGVLNSVATANRQCVLEGFAGCGKTVTVVEFARQFGAEIAMTAPTNKAIKVLREKAIAAGLSCDCMTIYKLMGIRPSNSNEKRSLRKQGEDGSGAYRVIVIDECSMVSSELMVYLQRHLRNKCVIYVGDPKQLPPVGETLSETFQVKEKATLSAIMRQRDDNPVMALTAALRGQIEAEKPDMSVFAPAKGKDKTGIYRPNGNSREWILKGFKSEAFRYDNNQFRYLAWTNRAVENINTMVRKEIYGPSADRFIVGERLLFRKPAFVMSMGKSKILFNTDEEAVITSIRTGLHAPSIEIPHDILLPDIELPNFTVHELFMESEDISGIVNVIHEDDAEKFAHACEDVKIIARQERMYWPFFYWFSELYANVQPVYAMTVHRSQGSTFGTVFLDLVDICKNRNRVEMLKLLYVAASRPSEHLVVVS